MLLLPSIPAPVLPATSSAAGISSRYTATDAAAASYASAVTPASVSPPSVYSGVACVDQSIRAESSRQHGSCNLGATRGFQQAQCSVVDVDIMVVVVAGVGVVLFTMSNRTTLAEEKKPAAQNRLGLPAPKTKRRPEVIRLFLYSGVIFTNVKSNPPRVRCHPCWPLQFRKDSRGNHHFLNLHTFHRQ